MARSRLPEAGKVDEGAGRNRQGFSLPHAKRVLCASDRPKQSFGDSAIDIGRFPAAVSVTGKITTR